MDAVFDIKQLFGNEYNSVMMLDYKRILLATKEYIECVENCIAKLPDAEPETFEHAECINRIPVDTTGTAFDNFYVDKIKPFYVNNDNRRVKQLGL